MTNKEVEYINKLLLNNGYKLTYQRRLLVEIFLKNPSKHFNPMEVYDYVKRKDNSIGLATIYRNLKILEKNDIIEEIIYKDKSLYELKIFGKKSIHLHILCSKCNRMINYVDKNISKELINVNNIIKEKYDFDVWNTDFILKGICNECLENKKGGRKFAET
ncbi:Fur family transcriptional regulator [Dethiothermospora halolimnae]|uniref:Fur family transcriptional regulator n=1 Tax=Dethiothermospora halolimnae TaxID=3114390 RepID=UPI003CCC2C1C